MGFLIVLLVSLASFYGESASASQASPIHVVVWDERQPAQKRAYENFLGNAIADHLRGVKDRKGVPEFDVKSVCIDDPEQGLGPDVLGNADVLIWCGHI